MHSRKINLREKASKSNASSYHRAYSEIHFLDFSPQYLQENIPPKKGHEDLSPVTPNVVEGAFSVCVKQDFSAKVEIIAYTPLAIAAPKQRLEEGIKAKHLLCFAPDFQLW